MEEKNYRELPNITVKLSLLFSPVTHDEIKAGSCRKVCLSFFSYKISLSKMIFQAPRQLLLAYINYLQRYDFSQASDQRKKLFRASYYFRIGPKW